MIEEYNIARKKIENSLDRITKYKVTVDDLILYVEKYLFSTSPIVKEAARILLRMVLQEECYQILRKIIIADLEGIVINRNDSRVRKWSKEVKKKNICEKCGSKDNLHAHHIFSWQDNVTSRIDLSNGICLCKKCHAEAHKYERAYALLGGTQ